MVFPYDYIYPEQYAYMCSLKRILDAKGHGLLEMPSGTGKTVALLSLIVAYQESHPEKSSRLIYCTRTVPEVDKALLELGRILEYRRSFKNTPQRDANQNASSCTGNPNHAMPNDAPSFEDEFLGVGLSSRKNLCINNQVLASSQQSGKAIDARCHERTASWVRRDMSTLKCDFFETLSLATPDALRRLLPPGVYTLDSLKQHGARHSVCPYFLARKCLTYAHVVIYSYHYLLDPKIADLVSAQITLPDTIVIFDEAHNIDQVCIDGLSVRITRRTIDSSTAAISSIQERVKEKKEADISRLTREYDFLLAGLRRARPTQSDTLTDILIGSGSSGCPYVRRRIHMRLCTYKHK